VKVLLLFLAGMMVLGTWAARRRRLNRMWPILVASFLVAVTFISFRAY
jgi:hypothetical protein